MSLEDAHIVVASTTDEAGEFLGDVGVDDDVLILEHSLKRTSAKVEACEFAPPEEARLPMASAANGLEPVVGAAIFVVEQGKVAKRRMEPMPAQEISAPKEARLEAPQPTFATPGMYASPGPDVPYRPLPWHIPLPPQQPQLHPFHPAPKYFFPPSPSLMPSQQPQPLGQPQPATGTSQIPDVEVCLQRLAVLQQKERLNDDLNTELEDLKQKHVSHMKDHLEAQLTLKAEVQRLAAENQTLRTQKNAIEEIRDRLRRELQAANKRTAATDSDVDERPIDRMKLQAAETLIAELRAKLAAEQSKNVAMEVEVAIRKDETLEIRRKMRDALKAKTLQKKLSVSSTSLQKTHALGADAKASLQEDTLVMEVHSSPSSPDPTETHPNENNNDATVPKGSDHMNVPSRELVADAILESKSMKEMRTYFRALKDHGLSLDEVVERVRRKYPNVVSIVEDVIPVVLQTRSANDEV